MIATTATDDRIIIKKLTLLAEKKNIVTAVLKRLNHKELELIITRDKTIENVREIERWEDLSYLNDAVPEIISNLTLNPQALFQITYTDFESKNQFIDLKENDEVEDEHQILVQIFRNKETSDVYIFREKATIHDYERFETESDGLED